MTIIGDRRLKEAADKIAKEKELQKVSIKKSDVELIVSLTPSIYNNYNFEVHICVLVFRTYCSIRYTVYIYIILFKLIVRHFSLLMIIIYCLCPFNIKHYSLIMKLRAQIIAFQHASKCSHNGEDENWQTTYSQKSSHFLIRYLVSVCRILSINRAYL